MNLVDSFGLLLFTWTDVIQDSTLFARNDDILIACLALFDRTVDTAARVDYISHQVPVGDVSR